MTHFLPFQPGYIRFTVPVNQKNPTFFDTETVLPDDDENRTVDVECVLKLPQCYTAEGEACKLLMICHGASAGATATPETTGWSEREDYNRIADAFVQADYAIFDCNGYNNTLMGCNFWGAPKGVEAWRKAYAYVTRNYNVEHDFSIYGFSMGGLTALHLAMNGFPNIRCIALGSPVLDLQKCWNAPQAIREMQAAYGMGEAYEPEKAIGCDPSARLFTVENKTVCLVALPPIKIWHGGNETLAFVHKNTSRQMVQALQNSGLYAVYREVENAGHEICYGGNAAVIPEFVYWVNRFN